MEPKVAVKLERIRKNSKEFTLERNDKMIFVVKNIPK